MNRSLSFVSGMIAIVVAAILLIIFVCDAQPQDAPAFAGLIAVPLAIAIGAAVIGDRFGLWRRFRNISVALFTVYAIGAGLVLLTMLVTTRMMFISAHDAEVAVVITIYATGVTLVFGNFVVNGLSDGIHKLQLAASQVQAGDFDARADERGNDELATLALTFNRMTGELRSARENERLINQTRRDWIAWVSHDLRTPLTSLRVRAEALSDGVISRDDEVSEYLQAIRKDADALNRLVGDLGELAQIDAGGLKLDRQPIDMGDLLSDTLRSLQVIASERNVTLTGAGTPDAGLANISPVHMQRVLNNLIVNAVTHTPAGGSVVVEVRRVAQMGARRPAVRFEIRDTGDGIPPEDLKHIFKRFYRGERSRRRDATSGMGLGLVIAREFVEAHGGRIGIDSVVGRGTTAWFEIA
jgi:signal transduction histidine kinase